MIKDPVIGEPMVVFYDRIGGAHIQCGIIESVLPSSSAFGNGLDISHSHQRRGAVVDQFAFRIAWSFAGPIPVTWRDDDPTPRGLEPVLSAR